MQFVSLFAIPDVYYSNGTTLVFIDKSDYEYVDGNTRGIFVRIDGDAFKHRSVLHDCVLYSTCQCQSYFGRDV